MLFEAKHSDSRHFAKVEIDDIICVPHCHTTYELLFVTSGSIKATINGTDHVVHENECTMILPMQIHSYSSIGKSNVKIVIFSNDYIADFDKEVCGREFVDPTVKCDNDYIILHSTEDRFEIKSILYKYCSRLMKNGIKQAESKTDDLSAKIVIYIQSNFKSKISLSQIASEFGYSYNYLSAYFKKQFGCGFSEYVNRFRLEEAVDLLKKSDKSITEIAFESGFCSIRSFNDVFKKVYGVIPSEMKRFGNSHNILS